MKDNYHRYYRNVSDKMVEKLKVFRLSHPYEEITKADAQWKYISCGSGERTLLLLAGGLGVGEAFFLHIKELESEYRIIAPTFPPVETMEEMSEGIMAIMDEENISSFSIMGQSFGGMLAQVLLHKYPDRVDKVILSHTTTTSPPISADLLQSSLTRIRKGVRLIRLIPSRIMAPILRKRLTMTLDKMHHEEKSFWSAYFAELIASKSKDEEIAMYLCMIDFGQNYHFVEESLENWHGDMLILESDGDKSISRQESEAVRKLYPEAEVYNFKDTGHLSVIVERDRYMRLVRDFLEKEN